MSNDYSLTITTDLGCSDMSGYTQLWHNVHRGTSEQCAGWAPVPYCETDAAAWAQNHTASTASTKRPTNHLENKAGRLSSVLACREHTSYSCFFFFLNFLCKMPQKSQWPGYTPYLPHCKTAKEFLQQLCPTLYCDTSQGRDFLGNGNYSA